MNALAFAVVAAVVGPVLTYAMAVRKLSGKVVTSEADSLWRESASMRDDYRQRMAASDARAARLEERVARLDEVNAALTHQNVEYERKIAELQLRVEVVERENESLKKTLSESRRGDD